MSNNKILDKIVTIDYCKLFNNKDSVYNAQIRPNGYRGELKFYFVETLDDKIISFVDNYHWQDWRSKDKQYFSKWILFDEENKKRMIIGYDKIRELWILSQHMQVSSDINEIHIWEDLSREITFQLLIQGWPIQTVVLDNHFPFVNHFCKLESDYKSKVIIGPPILCHPRMGSSLSIFVVINKNRKYSELSNYGTLIYDYIWNPVISLEEDQINQLKLKHGDIVRAWLFFGRF